MSNVLLIDFGSTYTKVTAIDADKGELLGSAGAITTVETDITEGLNQAMAKLLDKTGDMEFEKKLACSSAAGGLKMIAIGLVPEMTAEAAKRAALGAGAKVLGVYCHELSEYEIAEIETLNPDIILLAGGTDGGNKIVILHNAKMLCKLKQDVPVLAAGNKSVTPEVCRILSSRFSEVQHTENVMPRLNELNIEPARAKIRQLFLQKIVEAKGLNKANSIVDRMVMPTPAAVLKAVELLAKGTGHSSGLGDLMAVDIGGATTDVYSVAKGEPSKGGVTLRGLPEPYGKRTVEGDLGMRYSASALLRAAGEDAIAAYADVEAGQVVRYMAAVEQDIDYLPMAGEEIRIETAMAKMCTRLAAERHVGRLETYYTPFGSALVQTGKDLTQVNCVIGTGGVIIKSGSPEEILSGVLFDQAEPSLLKPLQPKFLIDKHYIMAAMGLLSDEFPETALAMMKKYIYGGKASGAYK